MSKGVSTQQFTQGHGLIVGAGADLPATVSDALGVASILRDPERCAYPETQVHVLTAEDATRPGECGFRGVGPN